MEHAPTVTLSYAFVYPEGIQRSWSRTVRPMALALAKSYIMAASSARARSRCSSQARLYK